jgi:hypothetical protein
MRKRIEPTDASDLNGVITDYRISEQKTIPIQVLVDMHKGMTFVALQAALGICEIGDVVECWVTIPNSDHPEVCEFWNKQVEAIRQGKLERGMTTKYRCIRPQSMLNRMCPFAKGSKAK